MDRDAMIVARNRFGVKRRIVTWIIFTSQMLFSFHHQKQHE